MKEWVVMHAEYGGDWGRYKDKGEAQRWCRWWRRTQLEMGRDTPGFRVQRAPARPKKSEGT